MCFDTPYCKHWEMKEQGTEELLGVWAVYIGGRYNRLEGLLRYVW